MNRKVSAVIPLVLVLGLALASVSEAALVGWWTFNEGAGTMVADSSGNGHNGTINGNPVWAAGMYGGALNFDGSGDYVMCDLLSIDTAVTGGMTVCGWINRPSGGDRKLCSNRQANNAAGGGFTCTIYNERMEMDICSATARTLARDGGGPAFPTDTWVFVAYVFDDVANLFKEYQNGVMVDSDSVTNSVGISTAPFRIGSDSPNLGIYYLGLMDDWRVYDHVLSEAELKDAMAGKGLNDEFASDPEPADGATDVLREPGLSWTASEFAATHDVYFGTSFDDVNDAGRTDPRDVLVGQDQADTTFDPGRLEFGQVYYWRVDEVNAAPDNTIFKGDTWSFTVEPYSYPIPGDSITAAASNFQTGAVAQNTVDGSGLNADDQHSVELNAMWLTAGGMPAWIQYDFDKPYKLDKLLVWNSNQVVEAFIGFGAKDVTIEYSTDGETWTPLEGVPEFAQATGAATYTANTTVDFGGVVAQHVKLTINSNWGGITPQTGLSEVRFFSVPVQAYAPQPVVGTTDVSVETDLTWRAGREATSHVVYVGTDSNAVADGAVQGQTVTGPSYTPTDLLFDTEYSWKVDEVGDTGTYAGDVWNFTTEPFAAVDDFEAYNDDDNRIYEIWIDGLTDGQSGSQVGYNESPFAEKTIVHSGSQSMPLQYDNTSFAFSETTRTFDTPQNWAARGIKALAVYFAGAVGNSGQLYLKINNTKVAYDGGADSLTRGVWQAWNVDLSQVGNVSSVKSLTIGVEGAGAQGTLYIDDIRLYPQVPEFVTPVDPGAANLVALYTLDGNANDTSGQGNNGTVNGTGVWVDGMINQGLRFDGATTYVDCGSGASLNLTDEITITAWIKMEFTAGDRKIAGNQDGTTGGYKMGLFTNNKLEFEIRTAANAGFSNRNATGGTVLQQEVWYHVAGVYSKGQFFRTYVFGNLDREQATTEILGASTGTFKLGIEPMSANYYWLGTLDDVRVYNRVLSQEEILWIMGQRTPVAKPF